MGVRNPNLPTVKVKLTEDVVVRDVDWTQYIFGRFEEGNCHTNFRPMKLKSRLQSMAWAEGVIAVPEGYREIAAGGVVQAQLLS